MAENPGKPPTKKPIVIKRIKKIQNGNHGGAWKIAYADFVTAMMAFFLLMWLLASTSQGDLKGIADYFKTPLKVALLGGGNSGDRTSILNGGGKDISETSGQVKRGDLQISKKAPNIKTAIAEIQLNTQAVELNQLNELKSKIESSLSIQQYKDQILLDVTSEGLRIQVVDKKNRPMFKLGESKMEPYTKDILHEIGSILNQFPNKVSLSGHTDAHQYDSGKVNYSNWDLSSDRAHASRRELVAGGMADSKIARVVGMSSTVLFDKTDPFNPSNRRINIIVMNKKTEELVKNDGGDVLVESSSSDVH